MFLKNIGSGSVKFYNQFGDENNEEKILNQNENEILISVSESNFEIYSSSSFSIFYNQKINIAVPAEVTNCLFTGDIIKGAHHIDGSSHKNTDENPKMFMSSYSCFFSNKKNK